MPGFALNTFTYTASHLPSNHGHTYYPIHGMRKPRLRETRCSSTVTQLVCEQLYPTGGAFSPVPSSHCSWLHPLFSVLSDTSLHSTTVIKHFLCARICLKHPGYISECSKHKPLHSWRFYSSRGRGTEMASRIKKL